MALNRDFLMGFLSGTVVGAVGYRLYEQNSGQLQSLIQQAPALNFSSFPAVNVSPSNASQSLKS